MDKYLKKIIEQWIRIPTKPIKGVSNIWNGLTSSFNIMGNWLAWTLGNRMSICVGLDTIIGAPENFRLST